jgi:hypothetical protein
MNGFDLVINFRLDPTLIAKVEDNLTETWEGVPDTQPTFGEVFDEALDHVARDILDDLAPERSELHAQTLDIARRPAPARVPAVSCRLPSPNMI